MLTVAVAGGTGGIGRTIVDELVRQEKYRVLILSRNATTIPGLNVSILVADYTSPSTLTSLLQSHTVNIVISALSLFDVPSALAQQNLISAAISTSSVTRFLPSEYGIDYTLPSLSALHPAAAWFNAAAEQLRASRLEFTRVIFGQLSDHYGYPRLASHMKQFTYFFDFARKKAGIPGKDGAASATFLHSRDVARYTVALLDEEEGTWPEVSAFASDHLTWGEVLRMAEEVTGQKWTVTYDALEDLQRGIVTYLEQPTGPGSYNMPDEQGRQMAAEFGVLAATGLMDVSLGSSGLRNSEFPHIKPMGVREIIEKAWGNEQ